MIPRQTMKQFDRSQCGSTMIEVLVSLLIVSFGLLGMAALQAEGIVSNQSAYYRTQAVTFANDMADRMRANISAVTSGSYDDVAGSSTGACYTVGSCSAAQMAGNDVFEWSAAVAASLPGGVGVVCRDASPNDGTPAANGCAGAGDIYAVKIWWDDDRDGNPEERVVIEFRPE
jgi:type IV pilus assembly protein PilV